MNKVWADKSCKTCGYKINQQNRHNDYCSKKCEVSGDKAYEAYLDKKSKKMQEIKDEVLGTTAWKPQPIEPITEIISSAPIMVFSDIHAPMHSAEWITLGIEHAIKIGAKTLIVNGDFIDANTISRHIGGYYRRKSELDDDLTAGEALTKIFSEVFEKVIFLSGNHCLERLVKVFRGEVKAQRIWQLFGSHPNIKLSARSFVIVNKDVVVGHPRQYSKTRGMTPLKIAASWQKHVILGHSHHSASTITQDGKWRAVDIPCMADLSQFEYTTFEINDMPKPVNGYAIINGTKITLIDHLTDMDMIKVDL